MTTAVSRREFLALFARSAGCFVATASMAPLLGCSSPRPASGGFGFPSGVASADPQPDAVVLWSRVVPEDDETETIALQAQLARDPDFSEVILEESIVAQRDFDFTVRCFVDGLEPDRHYYYRFLAPDGSASRHGRTRTAPSEDAERTLNAAVCSCQHYEEGFFSAYRRLLTDDERAPADRKIDVVIHVGDFIYEASNRRPLVNLDREEVELRNADGSPRRIRFLPSKGAAQEMGVQLVAESLDDYRELYKTYLTDPDLQEARATYPFVSTWDDHEFYNDAWQSFHPSGPAQRRKVASNQAWFEYIPAALSMAPDGPAGSNPARDFAAAEVADVLLDEFDENYLSQEPNNLAAIASLSIYRTLRWGRLVELILVDGRSYRGPRGVDTAIPGAEFITPIPVSAELVETQNAGRTANDGDAPETVSHGGVELPNSRKDMPVSSLLGVEQKAWLKASLQNSEAHWKVLCNNVPMMRFGFDMTFREYGNLNDLWWTDTWDGYPVERRELLSFMVEEGVTNVVSVTGDRHAHFAGVVYDDFDAAAPRAVLPEFVGSAITSGPRLKNQHVTVRSDPELDALVHFDGSQFGYDRVMMPGLNAWLLFGAEAAARLGRTGSVEAAAEAANAAVNPHLSYADTDGIGYFTVQFARSGLDVEFVSVAEPMMDFGQEGPPARRRARFSVPAWSAGEEPGLDHDGVDGEAPLLGLKPQ